MNDSSRARSLSASTRTPCRILHLNSMLTGGGTDDQCVKLVLGLHQLGQEVAVAGPEGRVFSKIIRETGVRFHVTPDVTPLKLPFILHAAKFIRRERVQIVHGHHGRDIWPTIVAARLSGVRPKIVLTRHMAKSPSAWISRRFLLGQCDAVIAVSHFVAHVLREGDYDPTSPVTERHARPPLMGDHSKIYVIYGGIDTNQFQPTAIPPLRSQWGLQPDDYAFAMVGGYDLPVGKGQREFLQAAAQVHTAMPNARFLIVGRGNMADLLRTDIERLGLQGKAWLTPYCDDMPQAMNAMDCLVHAQTATEAMGVVVFEAHACGRPVIASNLDGIPEALAVGGYGQLVRPGSVDELENAMRHWAQQPPLDTAARQRLHRLMREKLDIQVTAGKVEALYRRLHPD